MKKNLFSRMVMLTLCAALLIGCAACSSGSGDSSSSSGGGSASSGSGSSSSSGGSSSSDSSGDGTVYTLRIQNHDPDSSICAEYMKAWADAVTEASGGRLQFTHYNGGSFCGAGEAVDAVRDGQIDICWNAASINAGRFPYSEAISLPMLDLDTTVEAAKVVWYMYENCDYVRDEWTDFKVIQVASACAVPISTAKTQVNTVADFKGLRMRGTIPSLVTWMQELGMTPISVGIGDTYEQMEKNVMDGCFNDWHNLKANTLQDLCKYVMDVPVTYSQQCVLMNWDSYNKLPEDLQQIIDDHSGLYAAEMAGEYWDRAVGEAKEAFTSAGCTIYEPSAEVQAAMDDAAETATASWIQSLNDKGLDGQKVYDDLLAAIDAVK